MLLLLLLAHPLPKKEQLMSLVLVVSKQQVLLVLFSITRTVRRASKKPFRPFWFWKLDTPSHFLILATYTIIHIAMQQLNSLSIFLSISNFWRWSMIKKKVVLSTIWNRTCTRLYKISQPSQNLLFSACTQSLYAFHI